MWQIGRGLGAILMFVLAIEDIRYRKLSDRWLWLLAALACSYQIVIKGNSWAGIGAGLGIGMIFLVVSYFTKESLGYGDSILICILGIYVGGPELIEILIIAWSMAGVTAMVILVRKRFARKATLPFVPFMAAGYLWVSVGKYLEIITRQI